RKSIGTGGNIAQTFEVGIATDYTPISVVFASVTSNGTLIAKTTAGDHTDISNSSVDSTKDVNAFWTLTSSGIVFTNYAATFNFTSGLVDAGANTANFIVAEKNAGSWSLLTVGAKTSTSVQATGLTAFGDFVVGETAAVATSTTVGSSANPS